MRITKALLLFFFVLILLSGCGLKGQKVSVNQTNKDWAFDFVVWHSNIYSTSEKITKVGKEIGSVTKFSDVEGTYSDGFSNKFQVGTKLYEIPDIDTKKSIAIKIQDGTYVKADYQGKYGAK